MQLYLRYFTNLMYLSGKPTDEDTLQEEAVFDVGERLHGMLGQELSLDRRKNSETSQSRRPCGQKHGLSRHSPQKLQQWVTSRAYTWSNVAMTLPLSTCSMMWIFSPSSRYNAVGHGEVSARQHKSRSWVAAWYAERHWRNQGRIYGPHWHCLPYSCGK